MVAWKPKRICFIVNRSRRSKEPSSELLDQFHAVLREAQVDYALELSDSVEHSRELTDRAAERGFDTLWIGGGDGTINQLVNCTIDSKLVYGIVPMGTINALARALEIPQEPVEAVRYLLSATPTPFNVGWVEGRYFLCYATVGVHAALIHGVSGSFKQRFGRLAFFTSGVKTLLSRGKQPLFTLEFQPIEDPPGACAFSSGKSDESPPAEDALMREVGYTMVLSNICNYAGFGIVREAQCCSPFMELHLFRRNRLGPLVRWYHAMRIGSGRWEGPSAVVNHYHLAHCVARSQEPMVVQIDGEAIHPPDPRELHFRSVPRALRLLLKP